MSFTSGHLSQNPLPPGIVGALSLSGYQLLADVAGVGAGRLGQQVFLLAAPEPAGPAAGNVDIGTQISLHQTRLRDEAEASAFVQLAAQLGFLRLSGYRLALERAGLRSRINLVNPATGAVALKVPEKHPGRLFGGGGGSNVGGLLTAARGLAPAGSPPDLQDPEILQQMLLSLALRDDSISGAQAAELADRALRLVEADSTLEPARALEAAKNQDSSAGS